MNIFDESHRKVNPARESVGSDWFVVSSYDATRAVCDLIPVSINQRGTMRDVPVCLPFGGSWEFQQTFEPKLPQTSQPAKFGNVSRGPRWGMSLPVQPGDLALIQYAGESQSDPVITAFFRRRNDYSLAWSANQILGKKSDYRECTPADDDEVADRFDLLLPSGAWFRSSKSGSWVLATAPCDRPNSFVSLDQNGSFRIKSRGSSEYNIHLEFDSQKEEGRICVGSLEGGSYIQFKDGDIVLKAEKNVRILGQRLDGDLKPQHTPALDAIASGSAAPASTPTTPATPQNQPQLATLAVQSVGEQVLGGALTPAPTKPGVIVVKPQRKDLISNLISNPAIPGNLRGQLGDLLSDPQGLLEHTLNGFTSGMDGTAIARQLVGVLGANALMGNVTQITSQLDLGNLDLLKQLGVPSWVASTVQAGVSIPNLQLPDVVAQLSGLTDNALLSEVMKWTGSAAIDLKEATGAIAQVTSLINQLPNPLKNRVNALLEDIDAIPVKTPAGGDGAIDWHQTTVQRLGAHILKGNVDLGGKGNLFNLSQVQDLVDGDTFKSIQAVASQIEDYWGNPHPLVDGFEIPDIVKQHLPAIAKLPPEFRDVLAGLGSSDLANLQGLAKQVAEAVAEEIEEGGGLDSLPPLGRGLEGLSNLLKASPGGLGGLLQGVPQQVFTELSKLLPDQIQGLLGNPASVLNVDNDMLRSVFGEGFSKAAGVFDMRVSRLGKFNVVPKSASGLDGLGLTEEYNLQTFANPVTVTNAYQMPDLPDYWG